MTTTINISLNMPPSYGVERLTRQLTEYAKMLIAQDSDNLDDTGNISLTSEMLAAALFAEEEFKKGKCVDMEGFTSRFEKWL